MQEPDEASHCSDYATRALDPADLVYADVKRNARSAVLKLIEREREGELIDKAVLKNILDIFIEACARGGEQSAGVVNAMHCHHVTLATPCWYRIQDVCNTHQPTLDTHTHTRHMVT
jgi:hypothetical protein